MIEEGTLKLLIEVGNMPTKAEAVEELQKAGFMIAPSKASMQAVLPYLPLK